MAYTSMDAQAVNRFLDLLLRENLEHSRVDLCYNTQGIALILQLIDDVL